MPILFNTILREEGIDPKNVRLVRHKDKKAEKGTKGWDDEKLGHKVSGHRKLEQIPFFAGSSALSSGHQ